MREVSLDTIGRGAAAELWDREFRKLLENVQDPNTKAEEERAITLTVKFRPTENRDVLTGLLECRTKLAGHKPHGFVVHLGRETRGGPLIAVEQNQREIFPEKEPPGVTPIDRKEESNA